MQLWPGVFQPGPIPRAASARAEEKAKFLAGQAFRALDVQRPPLIGDGLQVARMRF
jgi:hypothetical protein